MEMQHVRSRPHAAVYKYLTPGTCPACRSKDDVVFVHAHDYGMQGQKGRMRFMQGNAHLQPGFGSAALVAQHGGRAEVAVFWPEHCQTESDHPGADSMQKCAYS